MKFLKSLLNSLKEGEVYSLTRLLLLLGYVTFLIVSVILAFMGKTWGNYGEFAIACGGSILVQLGNKYINSKYNTPIGELGKRV